MSGIDALYSEFGWWTLLAVAIAALVTSSIHGAVGVAGGFLMTAALSLLIGVRPVVPVMSVALTISHGTRSLLNLRAIDRSVLLSVMGVAAPMIVIGALAYGFLPTRVIAVVLGFVILSSIPIRHWARSRAIKAGRRTLGIIGAIYGFLAGGSVGSGMLLTPFMLGYRPEPGGFRGNDGGDRALHQHHQDRGLRRYPAPRCALPAHGPSRRRW